MRPDQLLPHVVHRHDEHAVGKALVHDHQHDGDRPDGGRWHHKLKNDCKIRLNTKVFKFMKPILCKVIK